MLMSYLEGNSYIALIITRNKVLLSMIVMVVSRFGLELIQNKSYSACVLVFVFFSFN